MHIFTHLSPTYCQICGIQMSLAIETAIKNQSIKIATFKTEMALRERLAERAARKLLK